MTNESRSTGLDLTDLFFSNEEYYGKLEELKRAHVDTVAELEHMYRRKLQLRGLEPVGPRWDILRV